MLLIASGVSRPVPPGKFDVECAGWSNLRGTALAHPGSFSRTNEYGQGILTLKSTRSTHRHDLRADCKFVIWWRPEARGQRPPKSVDFHVQRSHVLTVEGNGYAKVTSGAGSRALLDEMHGAGNEYSGYTAIPDAPPRLRTLPLVRQPDGTAKAVITLSSDVLFTRFNSGTSKTTAASQALGIWLYVPPEGRIARLLYRFRL